MPLNISSALGIHEQALMLRSDRAELLANNMANADTPGFKARDLDFKAVLNKAVEKQSLIRTTNGKHMSGFIDGPETSTPLYRTPLNPSVDGNTVDSNMEKSLYAENALQFQASYTFLNGKIKSVLSALRGE